MLKAAIEKINTAADEYAGLKVASLEEYGLGVDHLREWLAEAYTAGAHSKCAVELAVLQQGMTPELVVPKYNIRKFYNFMQEHGAWEAFKRNCRNKKLNGSVEIFQCPLFLGYIARGFKWMESKEGFSYWSTLDDQWIKACNE